MGYLITPYKFTNHHSSSSNLHHFTLLNMIQNKANFLQEAISSCGQREGFWAKIIQNQINKSRVLDLAKNYRIIGRVKKEKKRKPPTLNDEEATQKWYGVVMMITKLEGKIIRLKPTKVLQVFCSQCVLLENEEEELCRHSLSHTNLLPLLLATVECFYLEGESLLLDIHTHNHLHTLSPT